MINRLKKIPSEFKKLLKIISELSRGLGYDIYLVGGLVRDLILEGGVFDLDIVVQGDAIKLAEKLSKKLKVDFVRHHSFGTATVIWKGHKIDFALARTEKYSHWGALPKVKPASLAQDLLRRDFTI
ncbi:MAG: nucleotidyltransferase domain-containing protein, partial [Candidatus Omnitrophica bacterium]|nr:nucleotidyltransferase domain-containing protein [Candidatus Omnitrophota bacterium]